MKTIASIVLMLLTASFIIQKPKQALISEKGNSDTLSVPYTYWWPDGGPFTGLCGNPYSLVFTGTVCELSAPANSYPNGRNIGEVIWTPQKGSISIHEIKYQTAPAKGYSKQPGKSYSNEKYFSSDCFYKSNLRVGDKVMVFVYSYEGAYSIPPNSILRVESFSNPVVLSIEKYIKNHQDPLSIRSDTLLWKQYSLDYALKQIIDCRLSTQQEK